METFLTTTAEVLSILHLVSALLASGHVVLSHPQARGASLWLGLIWLVPWLGPLLYVLVGINRVPRRARGRIPSFDAVTPWMPNSRLRCLVGGDEAYAEMIAAIDSAQETVHLQSYIFDNDRAGELFCLAFERAIARGVVVRVLIDAVGASYSRPTIVGKLKSIGVEVARFMSTSVPWRWQYANMRNHRKLMVVDGTRAFFGGMNIREGCMDSLRPTHPTLDIHFQVEGPIITSLISLFSACALRPRSNRRAYSMAEARRGRACEVPGPHHDAVFCSRRRRHHRTPGGDDRGCEDSDCDAVTKQLAPCGMGIAGLLGTPHRPRCRNCPFTAAVRTLEADVDRRRFGHCGLGQLG